jgi:hypothetical protein
MNTRHYTNPFILKPKTLFGDIPHAYYYRDSNSLFEARELILEKKIYLDYYERSYNTKTGDISPQEIKKQCKSCGISHHLPLRKYRNEQFSAMKAASWAMLFIPSLRIETFYDPDNFCEILKKIITPKLLTTSMESAIKEQLKIHNEQLKKQWIYTVANHVVDHYFYFQNRLERFKKLLYQNSDDREEIKSIINQIKRFYRAKKCRLTHIPIRRSILFSCIIILTFLCILGAVLHMETNIGDKLFKTIHSNINTNQFLVGVTIVVMIGLMGIGFWQNKVKRLNEAMQTLESIKDNLDQRPNQSTLSI